MRATKRSVGRFERMQPRSNRIVHLDPGDMPARPEPSAPYLRDFLGSRGLAARL